MKKISFFLMAFGLVAASCTTSDFETVYGEDPHADFAQQFTQTFGNIAPGHDWGFSSGTAMRGASAGDGDMNNKTWEAFGGDVLRNITDEERQNVLDAIAKKVTGSKINEETIFPYENYFLQDVINFTNGSFEGAGNNNTQDASVNCLEAFSKGDNCGHNNGADNYVLVANSKQIDTYYLLRDGNQTRIQNSALMTDMTLGTDDEMRGKQFRLFINCHEEGHYSDYITVEVNGSSYICFDIACGDPAHDKDGEDGRGAAHNDWDYNDWILKITPAVPTITSSNGRRIIAEDLAAGTSDFDYNDVVFDAVVENVYMSEYNANKLVATIVLQAAGGTMPLYVAGKEVHEAFGVPTTTMVNTNAAGGAKKSPVSFTYVMGDADWSADFVAKLKDIPVTVETAEGTIELTVNPGAAPEKIAVPLDFEWTNEREALQSKYPNFAGYVSNPSLEWWK